VSIIKRKKRERERDVFAIYLKHRIKVYLFPAKIWNFQGIIFVPRKVGKFSGNFVGNFFKNSLFDNFALILIS